MKSTGGTRTRFVRTLRLGVFDRRVLRGKSHSPAGDEHNDCLETLRQTGYELALAIPASIYELRKKISSYWGRQHGSDAAAGCN